MSSEQEKISAMLSSLAGAVVAAIRSGKAAERLHLVSTLRIMEAQMPAVSEDTAGAKDFILALISLLDGNPVSAEGLDEPYAGIYSKIVSQAVAVKGGRLPGPDDEMREFLTQLSATVVLVMRKGTGDEKKALSEKLREIAQGMPEKSRDAGAFVSALAGLVGGSPVDEGLLTIPYSSFFRKVTAAIQNGSR